MSVIPVVQKLILLVSIMFAGYAFARKKLLNESFFKQASWLTINLFMTDSIFYFIMNVDKSTPAAEGIIFGTVTIVIGFIISVIACEVLYKDAEQKPVLRLLISAGNVLFIGSPVAASLYGNMGPFYVALCCIPFNLIVYSLGIYWLVKGKNKGEPFNWKTLISAPTLITFISVILFALKTPIPSIVMELAGTINGGTVPMSMLVVGGALGKISLKDAFKDKRAYVTSFFRLIVVPIITIFVLKLFISNPVILGTLAVISACPGAVAVSVLASGYDYDGTMAASGVLVSTVLSVITIPLMLMLV